MIHDQLSITFYVVIFLVMYGAVSFIDDMMKEAAKYWKRRNKIQSLDEL